MEDRTEERTGETFEDRDLRGATFRKCLLTVLLDEEWHHRLFAEDDLDVLAGGNR